MVDRLRNFIRGVVGTSDRPVSPPGSETGSELSEDSFTHIGGTPPASPVITPPPSPRASQTSSTADDFSAQHKANYAWSPRGNVASAPLSDADRIAAFRRENDWSAGMTDAELLPMVAPQKAPLAHGAFGVQTDTAHSAPEAQWALSALPGYVSREVAGDGSCWLSSAWYATMLDAFKNPHALDNLLSQLEISKDLLNQQKDSLTGLGSVPADTDGLVDNTKRVLEKLANVKRRGGNWVNEMANPANMKWLRAYGRIAAAAQILDSAGQIEADAETKALLTEQANANARRVLQPNSEEGPDSITPLARVLDSPIGYVVHAPSKKPVLATTTQDMTLADAQREGRALLLFAQRAGAERGHYSLLEPRQ